MGRPRERERNEVIYRARKRGLKYYEIADIFNLSIPRVYYICEAEQYREQVEKERAEEKRIRGLRFKHVKQELYAQGKIPKEEL
jgi:hypothetical protein